jgi:hypothetical protein
MRYFIEQIGVTIDNPTVEIPIVDGFPVISGINIATNRFDILIRLVGIDYSFDMMLSGVQADSLNWVEEGSKLPGYVQSKIDEWVVDDSI